MFMARRRSSVRCDSKSLRSFRFWLGAVAALLLAACSTGLKIGYSYADTLLLYTIDGYVGLTPEQEQLVKERSAALMAWHRSTQLRDYAQFVQETRRKLDGPVTASDVLTFNREVNARLAALGERAAPELAQLAITLTPDQLARIERKLTSDSSKARRELVQFAGKETLDERVRKIGERADYWFGSVNRDQLQIVRNTLERRPDMSAWWIDERERRQRELLTVLQRIQSERPGEAAATRWLRAYFAQLQAPEDTERKRAIEQFRANNAELIAQLINAATPEQRAALSRRLSSFAEEFAALASERSGPAG
jgi:hypothetical protein